MRERASAPTRDAGSFRDPTGYVFKQGERIIRAIMPAKHAQFAEIYNSGILQRLADKGLLIACQQIEGDDLKPSNFKGARGETAAALYEHPEVPMLSYPYEWTFTQLKDAAIAHLELQVEALNQGYVLSDASAYNMQFVDGKPIHIDVLSIQLYEEGQPWNGYNQFCRQFLLPLLVEAWGGVSYQAMYRGSIDGISFEDALAILPKRKLFTSLTGFSHVYLHGKSVIATSSANFESSPRKTVHLGKGSYLAILKQIQGFIKGLESPHRNASYWNSYATKNSYSDEMRDTKLGFIRTWAEREQPELVWDIGGNTGDFSQAALEGGAHRAVVIDNDRDSLEFLYNTRTKSGAAILPLRMNLSDPSADIGWNQTERKGLVTRANADGVLALALIHHLVIGCNLPLKEVVDWLLNMAPTGVIEFVPRQDPMVQQLLDLRSDIFSDYTEEHFRELVSRRKSISSEHKFDSNGRLLVSYREC